MERWILVADDDDAVRTMVGHVLVSSGFSIYLADSGDEAIRLFRLHQDRITAALIDVRMPGLDGPATLRELRDINPALPVVLMTGNPSPYTYDELSAMGVVRVFEKPIPLDDLVSVLRHFA